MEATVLVSRQWSLNRLTLNSTTVSAMRTSALTNTTIFPCPPGVQVESQSRLPQTNDSNHGQCYNPHQVPLLRKLQRPHRIAGLVTRLIVAAHSKPGHSSFIYVMLLPGGDVIFNTHGLTSSQVHGQGG